MNKRLLFSLVLLLGTAVAPLSAMEDAANATFEAKDVNQEIAEREAAAMRRDRDAAAAADSDSADAIGAQTNELAQQKAQKKQAKYRKAEVDVQLAEAGEAAATAALTKRDQEAEKAREQCLTEENERLRAIGREKRKSEEAAQAIAEQANQKVNTDSDSDTSELNSLSSPAQVVSPVPSPVESTSPIRTRLSRPASVDTAASPSSEIVERPRSSSVGGANSGATLIAPAKKSRFTKKRIGGGLVVIAIGGTLYKVYIAPRLAKRVMKMEDSKLKAFLLKVTFANQGTSKAARFVTNKRKFFAAKVAEMQEGRIKSLLSKVATEPTEDAVIVECAE